MQAFRLSELPLEAYAFSLGLASAPKVPGLAKAIITSSEANETGGGRNGEAGGRHGVEEGGDGLGVEKAREEQRKKKNVNRSLQRLKEQIKAEKHRKRAEVRTSRKIQGEFVSCIFVLTRRV